MNEPCFAQSNKPQCASGDAGKAPARVCTQALSEAELAQVLESTRTQDLFYSFVGDSLIVAAKVNEGELSADSQPFLCCEIQANLQPLSPTVYGAKFRWVHMDRAILDLSVMHVPKLAAARIRFNGSPEFATPTLAIDKAKIGRAGMQVTELNLRFGGDGETRRVSIFKGGMCQAALRECDIVYMADGEDLSFLVLNALDRHVDVNRFVFVGIHNATTDTSNARLGELIFGQSAAAYLRYMRFVTEEVGPLVEAGDKPHARYVGGFSNGGAWALDALLAKSEQFNGAIAMSTAIWASRIEGSLQGRKVFMGAGLMESGTQAQSLKIAAALRARGATVTETYPPSGHSMNSWMSIWIGALTELHAQQKRDFP